MVISTFLRRGFALERQKRKPATKIVLADAIVLACTARGSIYPATYDDAPRCYNRTPRDHRPTGARATRSIYRERTLRRLLRSCSGPRNLPAATMRRSDASWFFSLGYDGATTSIGRATRLKVQIAVCQAGAMP